MSDKDSAGIVSLDLVIENTVAKQIEKIAQSAVEPAKKQFSKVGKSISDSVVQQTNDIYKKINEPIQKAAKAFKMPKFEVATDEIGLLEQKLGNIGAQMGSITEKIAQVESEYEKISAQKGFDSDEAFELEQQLTSLQAKLISLQSTANSTEEKLNKTLEVPAKLAAKNAEKIAKEAAKNADKIAKEAERASKEAQKQAEKAAKESMKAAQKAQQAYQKAYDDIVRNASRASQQAQQWALKAERAHSRSAARTARQASKAYNKQAQAARVYANKYADAQSDSSDKAAKAAEKAYRRMEKTAQKAANTSSKAMRKMARDSSSSTSGMGKAFGKLGKTITRSLKAVFVTAVLYKFFNAFKDNITGAMSKNKQFAKSLNEIKANLSVAFTPIIEAVMPLITRLAQGLATVTKYIATFIAAIFGKTYKQAVSSTKALQSQAEKAKASTSRDFDELHNVEEDSGSDSDDSSVNYDALDTSQLDTGPMKKFQEILDKIKVTIEKVSPAFKNLYDKGIKPVAEWIGSKLKDAFAFLGELLEKVGNWLVDNKDKITKLGDSLGKLWGWLEPILNAAWDTLKNVLGSVFDGLLDACGTAIDVVSGVIDLIVSLFTGDWEGVKEAGEDIINGLWEGLQKAWENTKETFSKLWNGLIDIIKAIFGIHSPSTVLADIGDNLIQGLINGISETWEKLKKIFSEKLENFKSTAKEKFTNIKNTILDTFTTLKTGIQEKLSAIWDKFKEFVNKILGGVENMINKPINALNKLIDKLNKLKVDIPDILGGGTIGFNISKFSSVSIPRLAKGGIVDKPTLSLIGEAGKEAVVPLENNTEWMEKLSSMLGNTLAALLGPMLQGSMRQSNNSQAEKLVFNIDGKHFMEIMIDLFRRYPQAVDLLLE